MVGHFLSRQPLELQVRKESIVRGSLKAGVVGTLVAAGIGMSVIVVTNSASAHNASLVQEMSSDVDARFRALVGDCMAARGYHAALPAVTADGGSPLEDVLEVAGMSAAADPPLRSDADKALWTAETGCADQAYDATYGALERAVDPDVRNEYELALDEAENAALASGGVTVALKDYRRCMTSSVSAFQDKADMTEVLSAALVGVLDLPSGVMPQDLPFIETTMSNLTAQEMASLRALEKRLLAADAQCAAPVDRALAEARARESGAVMARFPAVVEELKKVSRQ